MHCHNARVLEMLTLLLLGQSTNIDAAAKRFEQFMAKADSLTVSYSVKVNGQTFGDAVAVLDRPSRLKVTFKSIRGTFAFVANEEGGIEIDYNNQMYSAHPAVGRLYIPEMSVADPLNLAIARPLVSGKRDGIVQAGGKPTLTPQAMVGNVATDEIYSKTSGMGGETELRANVDAQGRLMRFVRATKSDRGLLTVEFTMKSYLVGKPVPATEFSVRPPLGYSPDRLASADYGLPQAEMVPPIQLRPVAGGGSVTLKSLIAGKNTLVAVVDGDFPANQAAMQSTRQIVRKIPNSRLIVIGIRRDAAGARSAGATYFDPTGSQLAKLGLPGVPAFYLFDAKGKLAQMFFGFDGKWEGLDEAIARLK